MFAERRADNADRGVVVRRRRESESREGSIGGAGFSSGTPTPKQHGLALSGTTGQESAVSGARVRMVYGVTR